RDALAGRPGRADRALFVPAGAGRRRRVSLLHPGVHALGRHALLRVALVHDRQHDLRPRPCRQPRRLRRRARAAAAVGGTALCDRAVPAAHEHGGRAARRCRARAAGAGPVLGTLRRLSSRNTNMPNSTPASVRSDDDASAIDDLQIRVDDLSGPEIHALLAEHLASMARLSPPESVHALDLDGLRRPEITFWTA